MTDIKKAAPYLAGIGFATIFGFSFLIVKNTLNSVEVFQLLGLRFLIAAVMFELLRITKIIKINLKFKDIVKLLPVAVFQPVLYFITEVYGIKYSASSDAGLFIGMIPVAVALISWIFLKEKLNLKQTIFMSISIGGVAFISIMQMNGTSGDTKVIGYLFLIGAVIAAAFYNMFSRKASSKHSPLEITYVMMLTGAIVFNILGIGDSLLQGYNYFSPLFNIETIVAILYLGILSSVIAFFLVNFTLSKIPAVQSSLFANLITVISIIAGVIFLQESFTIYKIIGSICIIIGVFGTSYFSSKNKKEISNEY